MSKFAAPFDTQTVTEAEWQKLMRHSQPNGVFVGWRNELLVTADGSAMQVTVAPGGAHLVGFRFDSDAAEVLPIEQSDPSLPRVDRVVLRLDRVANSVDFAVSKGTPASSPVPPPLVTTDTGFEVSLAPVLVPAQAGVIRAVDVTPDTARFARWDHGSHLTGLGDDDHPQYLLTTGKAADANLLDGLDSTAFLKVGAKAADSDLLRGRDPAVPPTANTIAERDGGGHVAVADPSLADHATSKGYVDTALTNMGRIAQGSYTGNGAGRTISLPFVPKFIYLDNPNGYAHIHGAGNGTRGVRFGGSSLLVSTASEVAPNPLSSPQGFQVGGSAVDSTNHSGTVYTYTAIG